MKLTSEGDDQVEEGPETMPGNTCAREEAWHMGGKAGRLTVIVIRKEWSHLCKMGHGSKQQEAGPRRSTRELCFYLKVKEKVLST